MKCLITGGAGYIGNVLVDYLLKDDQEVTVYDNLMYKQTSLLGHCHNKKFNFVRGDVRDHENLATYAKEADIIFPLAAIVGAPACNQDKQLATDVNYNHVKFLAETFKDRMLIMPNTNSGYGVSVDGKPLTEESPLNPISHYGRTKCDAEKSVLDAGGVNFRLATVFGCSQRQRIDLLVNDFVYKALTDGYIVLFEKHFKRNYIHVRDVCVAFMFAIKHYEKCRGNIFNLGLSSANLSKLELAEKIKEYVPGFSIQCDDYSKDKDQRNYIISNDKIESLGWRPMFDLDDGIKEIIKGYKMIFHSQQIHTNL